MKNYFQRSVENPYHISIGGVVVNENNKICCHYFEKLDHPGFESFKDFYLLMRETIEPNETIEQCLSRGLQEEFGVKAELESYLGSLVIHFPLMMSGPMVEKTTLYFKCKLISFDESGRNKIDPEADSVIKWLDPKELIEKMKEQRIRLNREDADESKILERLLLNI